MVRVAFDGLNMAALTALVSLKTTVGFTSGSSLLMMGTWTCWRESPGLKVTVVLVGIKSTPGTAVPLVVVMKSTEQVPLVVPMRMTLIGAKPAGSFLLTK